MKKSVIVTSLILAASFLYGCDNQSSIEVDDSISVQAAVTKYLHGDFSECTTARIQTLYNSMDTELASLVTTIFDQSSVNVSRIDNTNYSVSISYPDIDSCLLYASTDQSFIKDYSAKSEDAAISYTQSYCTNLIDAGEMSMKTINCSIEFNGQSIVDDNELALCYRDVIEHEYSINFDDMMIDTESNIDATADGNEIQTISSDGCFIVSTDVARFLVYDIKCFSGVDALNKIYELSNANKAIKISSEDALYIEYHVKNLSNTDAVLNAGFVLADASRQIYSYNKTITGLTEQITLSQGESDTMSQFLIGSPGSELYWYSEGTVGSFHISVVL